MVITRPKCMLGEQPAAAERERSHTGAPTSWKLVRARVGDGNIRRGGVRGMQCIGMTLASEAFDKGVPRYITKERTG
jgi:hypothetical protein